MYIKNGLETPVQFCISVLLCVDSFLIVQRSGQVNTLLYCLGEDADDVLPLRTFWKRTESSTTQS